MGERETLERVEALGRPEGADNPDNVRVSGYGNSAEYTVARLKRDRPDLAERVVVG